MPHVGGALRALCRDHVERGVTTVFVAVSMLGLLAMTAFAFDFGRIYVEREQLQVGADAAALAIAGECANGGCVAGFDPSIEADVYADANTNDGSAWIQDVDLDLGTRTVTVITGTEDSLGNRDFGTVFAPIVGFDSLTIGAAATATWGPPGTLKTLPLTFSKCEWESFGEEGFVDETPLGFLHRPEAVLDGLLPPAAGYPFVNKSATIYFHGSRGPCPGSPSGQDLPGGFGWLETNGLGCEVTTEIGNWVAIDPGSSPSNGCSPQDLAAIVGDVVLIPYFDDYRGTGNGSEYHVYGFGALYVTGYYFAGQYRTDSVISGQRPCNGNDRCIEGYFIGDWNVQGGGAVGGPDLGVGLVQLIG